MNLKMVTWDIDLTQFLVEAKDDGEAIAKAIHSNEEFDRIYGVRDMNDEDDIEMIKYINDPSCYTVDDVDFQLLSEIIERTDYFNGMYGEAKVFNG